MKNIYTLLIVFLLAGQAVAKTAAFTDSQTTRRITQVFAWTFVMEYDNAFAVIDSIERDHSGLPTIPLLRTGVYYCRMLDFEDALEMDDFEQQYDLAWAAAEKLKKQGEIEEASLYLGTLLGFRALLYQRSGNWWSAVRTGVKSTKYLKSALKADSTLSDAYLGVGTYKYWSSKATDFINWLPLIPDQKDEGITYMRKAMEEGLFGKEISRSTLAWTLIDAGRPREAVNLSVEGLEKYPGSRFFLWTLANGQQKMGRLRRAAETYQLLYDSISPLERNNHYNELGICRKMAFIHVSLNNPEVALEWVNRGLAYELSDEVKERRKKTLATLQDMKKTLEKQLTPESGH